MGLFSFKFIAGYPDVKHYIGSLLGWESDPRILPKWTFDRPEQLRDTQWLSWFAGTRTRTLGNIRTVLIDIRPEADFKAGHVPFALNISYDDFKSRLGKWGDLAKLIGPAGVNPEFEAIIYGTGVSKESALVFWTLKYLGQSAASIGTEPISAWTAMGLKTESKPTVVRPPQVRFDMAIAPVDYKPKLQSALIADLNKAPVYPRIFVASGDNLAALPVNGTVKHIPASQTLENGALRNWIVLYDHYFRKNELPKMAEVVCYADDPADAALNWFVLKQIGYPNVTVLLR